MVIAKPELALSLPVYAIYEVDKASVELYQLIGNQYQKCLPNERGHYPIPDLGVELGIWHGEYLRQVFPWLRWWDSEGNLLLAGEERALEEKQRADQEKARADQSDLRADRAEQRAKELAAKLQELGIDPDA